MVRGEEKARERRGIGEMKMTRAEQEYEKQFPYMTPEEGLHREAYLAGFKKALELAAKHLENRGQGTAITDEIREL